MKRRKGFYSISVVAKMFEVHQQTIRLYEKEGLITPHRSEGNTRQFTDEDVDQLEKIIYLAGVEMILKLQKKIDRLQDEMNKAFEATKKNLEQEAEGYAEGARDEARQLMLLKSVAKAKKTPALPGAKPTSTVAKAKKTEDTDFVSELEIDYEDL